MKIIPVPGQNTLKSCAEGADKDIGHRPAVFPALPFSPDMSRPSPGRRLRVAFLPILLKSHGNSQKKLP